MAACIGFCLQLFCSSSSAQIKPRQNTFPSFAPVPPVCSSTSLQHSGLSALLCRKSFTNSASCLPLPHRQTSHHLTYRNIHTSCTKDVKRHQKMISHQRRWCPSPAPETLVLVVTLYEVDSRHCDMPLPSIFNTNSFLHQVTFPGRSSPTNQH